MFTVAFVANQRVVHPPKSFGSLLSILKTPTLLNKLPSLFGQSKVIVVCVFLFRDNMCTGGWSAGEKIGLRLTSAAVVQHNVVSTMQCGSGCSSHGTSRQATSAGKIYMYQEFKSTQILHTYNYCTLNKAALLLIFIVVNWMSLAEIYHDAVEDEDHVHVRYRKDLGMFPSMRSSNIVILSKLRCEDMIGK